jgi:hypothetical protein
MLFDRAKDVERWSTRLRHDATVLETWRFESGAGRVEETGGTSDAWIILTIERANVIQPMHAAWSPNPGDLATVLVHDRERERAEQALRDAGWRSVASGEAPAAPP